MDLSLMLLWLGIQESLISLPYTIYRHRQLLEPTEYAGIALTHHALLSVVATVVTALIALGLSAMRTAPELVMGTWMLSAMLPFVLLRQFGRAFCFAHLQLAHSLILDMTVAAVQITSLGLLAFTGLLSAATALAAIGTGCATTGLVWLHVARKNFATRRHDLWETLQQSWSLGRWFFGNQLTLLVQSYTIYWLLARVAGMTATGVYTACMTVAVFANPIMLGLGNILTPKAALAFKKGGGAALRREVARDSLLLGAAMIIFCVLAPLFGDDVMRLLFRGAEYAGQGHTVTVLTFGVLATAVGMPVCAALACIERPRETFWTGSLGAALTLALSGILVFGWGVLGVSYACLAGNVARLAARWLVFLALVPRRGPPTDPMSMSPRSSLAATARVFQQLTRSSAHTGCLFHQLDEGVQAKIYVVRSQSRRPIWQTHHELVIKLYKSDATIEQVRMHFDALSRVHAALSGCTSNGWKSCAPKPLYVCESPLALVMTAVPGKSLNSCLEAGDHMTPEVLESGPHALVAAMQACWSIGQMHGDLHFDNILCDIVTRELSFIDFGVPANSYYLCDDVTKHWYPASHDLAFMLYNTAVRLRSTIGKRGARLRHDMFAAGTLRAFVESIGVPKEKQQLLDEIQTCARAHLKSLDLSWSLRGLWHVLLRQTASRRIDKLLDRLRSDAGLV